MDSSKGFLLLLLPKILSCRSGGGVMWFSKDVCLYGMYPLFCVVLLKDALVVCVYERTCNKQNF